MAGSLCNRLWSPASAMTFSKLSMMLAVQARACAAWYMARTVCSASGEVRSARSALPISSGPLPAEMAGSSTSDRHQAPSASAILLVLSPWTRRSRSMAAGRNPSASWTSMNGTTAISSSRSRSWGDGSAMPIASRMTISSSSGIPVRSLTSWYVSGARAANRS